MPNLIDINEPVIRDLRFGTTSSSTIDPRVINNSLTSVLPGLSYSMPHITSQQPLFDTSLHLSSANNNNVTNPPVVEILQCFSNVTNVVGDFLQNFKAEKSPAVRKKAMHYPKVKNFILVFIVKFFRILGHIIKNKHIKDKLYFLQLKSLNGGGGQDFHADELSDDEKRQINKLASRILSRILAMKGSLQNCLVLLNMARNIDLDSAIGKLVSNNSKPHTLSYYYGMIKLQKDIFQCCLICGEMVNDGSGESFGRHSGDFAGQSLFGNGAVDVDGHWCHTDCQRWWQNRAVFARPSQNQNQNNDLNKISQRHSAASGTLLDL